MPIVVGASFFLAPVCCAYSAWSAFALPQSAAGPDASEYGEMSRRFIYALVPMGVSMWAAHLLYHFATAWSHSLSFVTPVQILALMRDCSLTLVCDPASCGTVWHVGLTQRYLRLLHPGRLLSLATLCSGNLDPVSTDGNERHDPLRRGYRSKSA